MAITKEKTNSPDPGTTRDPKTRPGTDRDDPTRKDQSSVDPKTGKMTPQTGRPQEGENKGSGTSREKEKTNPASSAKQENDPSRIDQTGDEEHKNDPTRIRKGTNEPDKNDPTRSNTPEE